MWYITGTLPDKDMGFCEAATQAPSSVRDGMLHLPDGHAIAARQGKLFATSFHPELTNDLRFHQYFLELATSESTA